MPKLKNLLIVALVFFLAMAGIAGWVLYRGDNFVKTGNILVTVTGPTRVKAGEEVTLQVTLANQNNAPVEFVDLTVEYPPGARTVGGAELTRERVSLGTLKAGEDRDQSFKALIFGEANTEALIKITTEYRLSDSNAIFDKTTNYALVISEAPVTLSLTAPAGVGAGQEFALTAEVTADARSVLADPTLLLHYPAGWQFKSATPAPAVGNALWRLTNLKPGEKRRINIVGVIIGQDNDEKAFRAEIGSGFKEERDQLTVVYDSELATVKLERSSLNFAAAINESATGDYLAESRERLAVELSWENNLPDPITDLEVTVALEGPALDRRSVTVTKGVYQSASDLIVWNPASDSGFGELGPGETGRARFSFAGLSLLAGAAAGVRNPDVVFEATIKGERQLPGGEGQTQPLVAKITRRIKYNSVVQLTAKALYASGAFVNAGPLPPRVDQKTTYTVVWSLLNSSNDLNDGRVQATLPPNVEWLGVFTPANEATQFVKTAGGGGEVIWEPGRVAAGTGVGLAAREISFQIALTPNLDQVGEAARLSSAPELSATDSFTGKKISGNLRQDLTTALTSDPNFKYGDEKVIE